MTEPQFFDTPGYGDMLREQRHYRQAVRIGNFKGVRYGVGSKTELYDLSMDVGEEHDIAAERPELVAEIERRFREERRDFPEWPYGRELE